MPTFATLWRTWVSTSSLDVDEEGLSERVSGRHAFDVVHDPLFALKIFPQDCQASSLSACGASLAFFFTIPQAACRPPPWNRPAAPGRPAGARPQRGPRVNLLNWRANWRLSSRRRFWLRGWGNQIEYPPGYSVPPSIEMDAASRCILAPRQVATESAVEGACGPHVILVVAVLADLGLGCMTSRPQDCLQDIKTTSSPQDDLQVYKFTCKSSRPPSPTCIKTDLDFCLVVKMDGRDRGWWWGTSECTTINSTLMVRFGVGMGWANSMFLNVDPPNNVKGPVKQRQGHRQAASRSSSSLLKVTVKHRQDHPNNKDHQNLNINLRLRLRPCASRPPWNRCTVSGRCTGARPHRGPRVNLLEFGEGQLACFSFPLLALEASWIFDIAHRAPYNSPLPSSPSSV
ncbi:uncharacterized protein SCHCODRAFT_01100542 [Schizophyllum commune H4-8]|nr:uncharacterized protein SCHCODRAFT_01100542 [Schizophyllum commune H4-8]KAI5889501.1 hypothetical protein SCHCODRAFT_01100542 [Schizophyllum commune H4-8]